MITFIGSYYKIQQIVDSACLSYDKPNKVHHAWVRPFYSLIVEVRLYYINY